MSVTVQAITEPLVLGEGPHWDDEQQALFFVCIEEHTIHKYVPSTKVHTKTKLAGCPGFILPVEGAKDQFVVGLERRFVVVQWDGQEGSPAVEVREIAEIEQEKPMNRINDGKADPRGRLFAGSMGPIDKIETYQMNNCSLYRLDGSSATKIDDKISASNGMAWDAAAKAFYYTDSMEANIRRYDYDINTGEISNMKHIFDFKKNDIPEHGLPDGFTIDTDGNLWIAAVMASCVIQVDPKSGKLLQKVEMPVKMVTSVTFGGPNMDILFVTTASLGEKEPPNGATFMVTGLGVKGHPNVKVKL